MVTHIVLFTWKPAAAPEAIDRAVAELRALKGKIPGIVELSSGANFSERAQGFHHGLLVRFTDRAALEVYGPHPAHQRVLREFLTPIMGDVVVVDYES